MRPQSAHSGLRGPPMSLCDIMQRGYLPQVPLLVNLGANLETRDPSGRTPLMLTAYVQPESWGVGIARLLIEEGVKIDPRDRHGMNAMHHACVYERVELAKVLLHAPDFNLLQTDKFGNTALHYAAMNGNADLVRLLVSYHQKYRLPFNKPNKQTRTAKEEALHCGSHQCAAILEEAESPKPTTKTAKNHKNSARKSEGEKVPAGSLFKEIMGDSNSEKHEDSAISSDRSKSESEGRGRSESKLVSGDGTKPGKKISDVGGGEEVFTFQNDNNNNTSNNDDNSNPILIENDDDAGGLFPSAGLANTAAGPSTLASSSSVFGDGVDQGRKVSGHLGQTTGQNSDRSSSEAGPGSPRMQRKSAVTRPRLGSVRRNSTSSSSSSRSGASARKQPMLSPTAQQNHRYNSNTAVDNIGDHRLAENADVTEAEMTHLGNDITAKKIRTSSLLRRPDSASSERSKNNENIDPATASLRPPAGPRSRASSMRSEASQRLGPNGTFITATNLETATSGGSISRPRSYTATSRVPLMPFEKNPEQVIHVASDTDFRNSPEYVLKLTRMEWSPAHMHADVLPVLVRHTPGTPPVIYNDERARQKPSANGSWRDNIRFLYRHYEYQCSPSWRNAAKQSADPYWYMSHFASYCPYPPGEMETDESKDKKLRRPSSSQRSASQMNDISSSSSVKRRPMSSMKQRKISTINSPGPGGDAATVSSGDSSSTGGQLSRKRSEIRAPDSGFIRQ